LCGQEGTNQLALSLASSILKGRCSVSDRVGQQLGNYRLLKLLGQGGFADVYLGEHIHLSTQAAIKVLRTQLTSEDIANFRIEARTIAHLSHPNIVQVLDFGVENNAPFLVMAYAPNGTLRQRYERGQSLPPMSILAYVKEVASALQYAHDQKLIHRDVKPENMLIGRNNEILLSDFGIALPTASARPQNNASSWDPVGTVTYMAPEQIQGKPTVASDQYALGITVYEWICGYPPFKGGYLEVAMQKISNVPEPLLSKVPDLPADVEMVIMHALERDPQQRFRSVQAFAVALEQAYNPAVVTVMGPVFSATLVGASEQRELRGDVIRIGRNDSNQVLIKNDPKISANHGELRLVGRGYWIIDLNSTNGTFVNGEKLTPNLLRELKSGDTISIGDTKYVYKTSGVEAPQIALAGTDGSTVRSQENAAANMPVMRGPEPAQSGGYGAQRPVTNPPFQFPQTAYAVPPAGNQEVSGQMFATPGSTPRPSALGSYQQAANYAPLMTPPAVYGPTSSQPGFVANQLPGTPLAVPTNTGRKRPPWLIGVFILLLIVVVGGSVFGLLAYLTRSTPAKALSTFCSSLLAANSQNAYNQLSTGFQQQVPLPIFSSFFGGVNTCTPGNISGPNNNTVETTLALNSAGRVATDMVNLVHESNGSWKIASESGISGLVGVLQTYCSALQQGQYQSAYDTYSSTLQQTITENLLPIIFPKVSACTYTTLKMMAGGAQITISDTEGTGTTANDLASLVPVNTSWQINDLSNLPNKALAAFCSDLQNNDYQDAYALTSSSFDAGFTLARFTQVYEAVSSCTFKPLNTINGNITSDMTFHFKTNGLASVYYTGALVQDSDTAKWKLDSLTNMPEQTLTTFCSDIANQDYTDAYALLTSGAQAITSQQAFVTNFSTVRSCTPNFPSQQSGDTVDSSAQALIHMTFTDGSTAERNATLTAIDEDIWKIGQIAQ
jgi:serine/threonine protein kinase